MWILAKTSFSSVPIENCSRRRRNVWISPESLSTVPEIFQTGSELEAKILIVSRYIVTAHRGDAFFLGRVLALRVTSHRFRRTARRRRHVARQSVVVVRRRWTPSAVLASRRLDVEHGRVGLDVRVDLKESIEEKKKRSNRLISIVITQRWERSLLIAS